MKTLNKQLLQPAVVTADPRVARLNDAVIQVLNNKWAKNRKEIAAKLDYGYSGFSAMLAGHRPVTDKFISVFAKAYGFAESFFDNEQASKAPPPIPGSRIYHLPAAQLQNAMRLNDIDYLHSLACWSMPGLQGDFFSITIDVKQPDAELPVGGIAICIPLANLEKLMLERRFAIVTADGVFFGEYKGLAKGFINLGSRKIAANNVDYVFQILSVIPPVFT